MKENFETNVKGLFSGCVFPWVSGAICGGTTRECRQPGPPREDGGSARLMKTIAAREKEQRSLPRFVREEGLSYREFEGAVRTVMDYYMGLRRNQKGMEIALEKLNFIGTFEPRIKAQDDHELLRTHEGLLHAQGVRPDNPHVPAAQGERQRRLQKNRFP